MIPYGRQDISDADIQAVVDVLRSDFLTQGPVVPQFEEAIANASGASFAIAMNSATSALHVAVDACGLGPGDLLWTSPITFVASANCALYCGAEVDFVDIQPDTFNMCPLALARKLEDAKSKGRLPKVIIPVHMGGQSSATREIADLVKPYGIKIVEDASHAVGGSYLGMPVGCCLHSDITIFSFHPVKIITSAEGGMAVTNNADLAAKMERARSHGITRDPAMMTHASDGPWYYQMVELGWNYRMTELQAALGLSQCSRLKEFVNQRNEKATRYDQLLADLPVDVPGRQDDTRSAFHLYIIRLKDSHIDRKREIFEGLRAGGIGVNLHYIPVHLQPYYRNLGFKEGNFPVSEDYYKRAISIPLYPALTDTEQEKTVSVLQAQLS